MRGKAMTIERRFNPNAQVIAVAAGAAGGAGAPTIRGYAAVFNAEFVLYEDSGYRVVEVIAPGAFTPVLGNDVRCLFNHAADHVLGRSTNGTLQLIQDSKGLRFSNALNLQTSMGKNVYQFVKRGDVTGCSFAFTIGAEGWDERQQADGRIRVTRTIVTVAKLFDVGP